MRSTRRNFLQGSAAGLISANMPGGLQWLTPSAAFAASAPLSRLTAEEGALLGEFADILVPSAKAAGVAHFVDHHLTLQPADCFLILRYLDWPPPFLNFYRDGLSALTRFIAARAATGLAGLDGTGRENLVRALLKDPPPDWSGSPSAQLFYFVLRADAIDVAYGTQAGFERLGIPYLAHIEPASPW